jgi:hypothetical protein
MDYFSNFVDSMDLSYADQIIIYITHQLSVLLNLISYAYILAKFYKVYVIQNDI